VKKVTPEEMDILFNNIENVFFFCMVWSLCCTVDYDGRAKIDVFLRKKLTEVKAKVSLPPQGTIFDYYYNLGSKAFESWAELYKDY
jgi:dynein heavy chain